MTEGIYVFWKPKGVSSNGFLNRIRKETGIKKIGHAGTLDPLAEGIIVVGIGKGTKLLTKESGAEKEYIAEVCLGSTSETDDEEGSKTEVFVVKIPKRGDVSRALRSFKKETKQIPPVYSAIKIKGKEAYKLARKGKKPEMKPRHAEIRKTKLLSYKWPFVSFKIITGPGVYIRSVARDLGEKLGVGGYLSSLKRTRVGRYTKSDALTLKSYN
ncbi:MAG: tRNA pseudouridine(55) synthase TruB [Parcubacteria group bacterium]